MITQALVTTVALVWALEGRAPMQGNGDVTEMIQSRDSLLLYGDHNFPVLNEIRWEMNMAAVRALCEGNNVPAEEIDSTLTLNMRLFGFAAQTRMEFNNYSQLLKRVDVKFAEPSKLLCDSLVNYFTARLQKEPERKTMEKGFLFFSIRAEIWSWSTQWEGILVSGVFRGESVNEVGLQFMPVSLNKVE